METKLCQSELWQQIRLLQLYAWHTHNTPKPKPQIKDTPNLFEFHESNRVERGNSRSRSSDERSRLTF